MLSGGSMFPRVHSLEQEKMRVLNSKCINISIRRKQKISVGKMLDL